MTQVAESKMAQQSAAQAPAAGAGAPAASPSPMGPPSAGGPAGAGAPPPGLARSEAKEAANDLEKKELQDKVTSLEKNLDLVVKSLDFLSRPMRKSITGLENMPVVNKELSKAEVKGILHTKIADPKLSKSDRDLISGWYLGDIKTDAIKHLLQ
jgi:hypothetical protein